MQNTYYCRKLPRATLHLFAQFRALMSGQIIFIFLILNLFLCGHTFPLEQCDCVANSNQNYTGDFGNPFRIQ